MTNGFSGISARTMAVQGEEMLQPDEVAAMVRLHELGWPDLTLWRDGEIRFVEVKAPGDSMHASQARLISTILVPLGFRVGIAEIRPA